jgi:hypothetical protein
MRLPNQKRRGGVAVLVALCLVMLMGFVAVALDGGLLLDQSRHVQAVADAAALSAAEDLYLNFVANKGLDPNGTAKAAALGVASAQGYPNNAQAGGGGVSGVQVTVPGQSSVQVNIPPLSGPFTGLASYVEVILTYNQPRYFSSIWGTAGVPVVARAVGQGQWAAAKIGILVLNPTAPGAMTLNGNGSMVVSGVPTIVDSNAPNAVVSTGGANVTSPEFDITGVPGVSGSGSWTGNVLSGQTPVPDPLAYLAEPDPNVLAQQGKNNGLNIAGNSAKTVTIWPGVYNGGIKVSGQVTLVMMPGIYYMNGGGFSFTGQGNLNAQGVMIFNAPQSNSDVININGNGNIVLTPPTSGIYQGISLFQERTATNTIYITGNGTSTMAGTFYAQHGILNVTGNGTGDVIGSQYISDQVVVGGGGSFAVSWNANQAGRTRILRLVE